ncbi:MAG: hypothetical protein IPG79_15260 [Saprospiraceae bacterium]|nr:hypothetical protein [Saprospiraceae bacterium]
MNKTYPDFNFNGVGEHFRIIEIIAVLFLIFVGSAIVYFESWMPVLVPLVFLFMAYVIRDVRIIFYFIFIVIPFSIEFYFEPIGFGSDLPSEPLMILITVGSLIFMAKKKYSFPIDTIKIRFLLFW